MWRSKSFTYREFLIELVGEEGVWQLSEVQLTQGAHTVDVLDVHVFGQVGDLLRVELVPDGGERAEPPLHTSQRVELHLTQRPRFFLRAKFQRQKSGIWKNPNINAISSQMTSLHSDSTFHRLPLESAASIW